MYCVLLSGNEVSLVTFEQVLSDILAPCIKKRVCAVSQFVIMGSMKLSICFGKLKWRQIIAWQSKSVDYCKSLILLVVTHIAVQ